MTVILRDGHDEITDSAFWHKSVSLMGSLLHTSIHHILNLPVTHLENPDMTLASFIGLSGKPLCLLFR